jgi:hypothetical protein
MPALLAGSDIAGMVRDMLADLAAYESTDRSETPTKRCWPVWPATARSAPTGRSTCWK